MELITGLEPVTSYLPSKCSTAELYEPELQFQNLRWRIIPLKVDKLNLFLTKNITKKSELIGGGGRIRTFEARGGRFTVCWV